MVQRLLARRKAGEDIGARKTGPKTPGQLHQHRDAVLAMVEEHPDWTLQEYCDGWAIRSGMRVGTTTMWRFLTAENISLKKDCSQSASR